MEKWGLILELDCVAAVFGRVHTSSLTPSTVAHPNSNPTFHMLPLPPSESNILSTHAPFMRLLLNLQLRHSEHVTFHCIATRPSSLVTVGDPTRSRCQGQRQEKSFLLWNDGEPSVGVENVAVVLAGARTKDSTYSAFSFATVTSWDFTPTSPRHNPQRLSHKYRGYFLPSNIYVLVSIWLIHDGTIALASSRGSVHGVGFNFARTKRDEGCVGREARAERVEEYNGKTRSKGNGSARSWSGGW
ncbi:hypothetical protein CPB84DRAFT_1828417, partial [Gymnopilus junonius]